MSTQLSIIDAHRAEPIPKFEIRNKFKLQRLQSSKQNLSAHRFGHLNLSHSNLPFDVAQGGEALEPFRISCFVFRASQQILSKLQNLDERLCAA
jgi:hypothetical protein